MGICGKCSWVGVDCDNNAYWLGSLREPIPGIPNAGWYGGPDPEKPDTTRGGLQSHGTKVAGVITAGTNNTVGISGCAPNILVLPIRLNTKLNPASNKYEPTAGSMYKAYKALLEEFKRYQWTEDVRVVNMSYGGTTYRGSQQKIIDFDQKQWDRLYVAAAGNNVVAQEIYPAAYNEVLGVTGLIYNWEGSSWLPSLWNGSNRSGSNYLDLATYPVSGIYGWSNLAGNAFDQPRGRSLSPPATNFGFGTYDLFSFTSACAPQVSALAALLFTEHPERTHAQVEAHIIATRDDSMLPLLPNVPGAPAEPLAGLVDFDNALSTW